MLTVEHAGLAFSASWHESQETAAEVWDRPAEIDGEHTSQKKASFNFDLQTLQHLLSSGPNERERQRLLRVAQPHACGFLTGVPSEEDGNDTILRSRNSVYLGVPLFK